MIEFPKDVYNNVFDGEIKRGTVVKTGLICHDGVERPHFYITVSYYTDSDPLVFVVSTSSLDFYNLHPEFNKDIIRVSANEIAFFPVDTIIDCRKIFKIAKEKLKSSYYDNTLRFSGELPNDYLRKIDKIIKQTRFIPKNDKRLILGNDFDTQTVPTNEK